MPKNLSEYTIKELREMLRARGGKPIYGLSKAELVAKLQSMMDDDDLPGQMAIENVVPVAETEALPAAALPAASAAPSSSPSPVEDQPSSEETKDYDLSTYTILKLRELAFSLGVKPIYGINKAQLLERVKIALEKKHEFHSRTAESEQQEAPEPSVGLAPVETTVQDAAENSISEPPPEPVLQTISEFKTIPEPNQQKEQQSSIKEPSEDSKPLSTRSTPIYPFKSSRSEASIKSGDTSAPTPRRTNAKGRTDLSTAPDAASRFTEESKPSASIHTSSGVLVVNPEGYGFIRKNDYFPTNDDVYVPAKLIKMFHMKAGDFVEFLTRPARNTEKYAVMTYVKRINGDSPHTASQRPDFEQLTPIFPNAKLTLETPGGPSGMRMMDLFCPIGKGQRGLIVAPPKAGKTTLLKQIAQAVIRNNPEVNILILLIDERPEEVTDFKDSLNGSPALVFSSTFDEAPERHIKVAELVLERAKRLVEHGKDALILMDSLTRLTRANNIVVEATGRTLSGGLDAAALRFPKRFLGAARNVKDGGSLTILASTLVETGSRMDDVIYEEFKGTGNMEVVLDRQLAESRIFPAIDVKKSGTRRDDLLLDESARNAVRTVHKVLDRDATERIIALVEHTEDNAEMVRLINKQGRVPDFRR